MVILILFFIQYFYINVADEPNVSSSPKVHHRSQSDGTVMSQYEESYDNKKETDKKSVKNILSQLLPSTITFTPIQQPFVGQEHYTLPTGVSFPVIVYETEPSTIVAYALNTYDYKRNMDEMTGKKLSSAEQTPSPVHKRRSQSEKDRNESNEGSSILSFLRSKDSKNDLLNISSATASEPWFDLILILKLCLMKITFLVANLMMQI